jgi:hypothetical protein
MLVRRSHWSTRSTRYFIQHFHDLPLILIHIQGMDQSYERVVHNQLVDVTCKPESGQYFLITPKLLPSLRYHKSMRILCVNNGEWLPEATSAGVGDMRKMIDNYVARNRAGQGPSAN